MPISLVRGPNQSHHPLVADRRTSGPRRPIKTLRRPARPVQASLTPVDHVWAGTMKAVDQLMLASTRIGRSLYIRAGHASDIEVHTLRYGPAPHQVADLYRPRGAAIDLPLVVYGHGGGFVSMDKDSHWTVAMPWAELGCVVVVPRYAMAPAHTFPHALADMALALEWALRQARSYGANPTNLVLAGESAGANLASALAICMCYADRPEGFARRLYALDVVPKAVFTHAGTYQLTEWDTLYAALPPRAPRWLVWPIIRMTEWYLGDPETRPDNLELASPTLVFEQRPPSRPLPPFRLSIGGNDPLLPETKRFAAALTHQGLTPTLRVYEGQGHVSHMTVLSPHARQFWRDSQHDLQAVGVLKGPTPQAS